MKKLNGNIRCYSLIGSLSLSLVACGGSSGSGSSSPAEVNTAPSATDVALTLSSNGPWVGTEINIAYVYSDDQNDTEGATQFRWLRDGSAIEGAIGASYILQVDDADKSIAAEVTPIATAGVLQGEAVVSAAITPVQNQAPVFNQVSIQPSEAGLFVGLNIEAVIDYSDADNDLAGDHVYQWLRNGEVIAGANQKIYKMLDVDAEQQITVSVTPVATAGQSPGEAVVSSPIVPVANSAPIAENVHMNFGDSGADSDVPYSAPKVGITITGHYEYADLDGDEAARPDLRWLRDNQVIEGATTASYTVQAEDEGKRLSFEVTPKALTGWLQGSAYRSEASAPAVVNFAPQARNVRLEFDDNKIKIGTLVTVAYDYFDEDGDAEKGTAIKFLLNGSVVETQQAGRFVATEELVGDKLSAEVSPKSLTGLASGEAKTTDALSIYPLDRHFFIAETGDNWDTHTVLGVTDGRTEQMTNIVHKYIADSEPGDWHIPNVYSVKRPVLVNDDPLAPKWLYLQSGRLVYIKPGETENQYLAGYLEGDTDNVEHNLAEELYQFQGKTFFSSDISPYGNSLWLTDGTKEGLELVADISTMPLHIDGYEERPRGLIELNNKLYFTASNNEFTGSGFTGNGNELWVYEGKVDGEHKVRMVADIYPGVEGSKPLEMVEFAGDLYFSALGGVDQGRELWKTDGTEEGTVLVANLAGILDSSSNPTNFTVVGERLFFTAYSDDSKKNQPVLWMLKKGADLPVKVQGVPATTPSGYVSLQNLTAVADKLFFTINYELYYVDSASDSALKVLPALGVGEVKQMLWHAAMGEELYFTGHLTGVGNRMFKVNQNVQIELLSQSAKDPGRIVTVNKRLLFGATDDNGDTELWASDGSSAGTKILKDIHQYGSSKPEVYLER